MLTRTTAACTTIALAALAAAGCGSSDRIAKANDALRLEREAQSERIRTLESDLAETRAKLTEANARLDAPVPQDVLEALPRVASIAIGRLSLIEDGRIVVFVSPSDGRGRFVQAVGTLEVRAVEISGVGAEPRVLGEAMLSPTQLRDAYVSGLSGTAYRVPIPLAEAPASPVTLAATLHDHLTGATHTAERIVTAPITEERASAQSPTTGGAD